jgi:eukaryotic-like serine/threonine-protein kinase
VYNVGDKVQGYTIKELITIGNNSVAYAATDAGGRKVFFKAYQSPSIRVPWYKPFVEHQKEMKARIEGSPCRQFCYQFLGGFEHGRKFHQVFEFLDKSHSLDKILARVKSHPTEVPWSSRELMAKVLVAGIAQLHAAGIVHADLKPDNIMLIEDHSLGMKYRLKIIDMDFSFFTDKKAPWHGHEGYFGTPGYMSPEHGKVPVPVSDVFTVGIILYQLLGPGHPYPYDDNDKILAAYKAYKVEKPKLAGAPTAPATAEEIAEVLHRCLHPEAVKRPSAAELHKTLLGEKYSPLPPAPPVPVPAPRPAPSAPVVLPAERPPSLALAVGALVLVGPGGTELSLGARLAVGRTVLTTKFGEGGRFAADQQFILDRKDDGWYVEPVAGTVNATLLNGNVLTARTKLAPGDTIGVGNAVSRKSKLDMQVRG